MELASRGSMHLFIKKKKPWVICRIVKIYQEQRFQPALLVHIHSGCLSNLAVNI